MINSYWFQALPSPIYKKWSPEINHEERIKKKKEREDEYLKSFSPDDRPMFVVN